MNSSLVASVVPFLLAIGACRSVPRDACGRPLRPPSSAAALTAKVKFTANVEPGGFVGLVVDSVTKRPYEIHGADNYREGTSLIDLVSPVRTYQHCNSQTDASSLFFVGLSGH